MLGSDQTGPPLPLSFPVKGKDQTLSPSGTWYPLGYLTVPSQTFEGGREEHEVNSKVISCPVNFMRLMAKRSGFSYGHAARTNPYFLPTAAR